FRSATCALRLMVCDRQLAMAAPHRATLVAHCQPPAAAQASALEDRSAVLGLHAIKEAMFSTTGNALWLPCSLRHCSISFSLSSILPLRYTRSQRHIRTIRHSDEKMRRGRRDGKCVAIIHRNEVDCQIGCVALERHVSCLYSYADEPGPYGRHASAVPARVSQAIAGIGRDGYSSSFICWSVRRIASRWRRR